MALHKITFILVIIGGLNWLLLGAFGWELGQNLLGGQMAGISRVIYVLVGLSSVYLLAKHKGDCKCCSSGSAM